MGVGQFLSDLYDAAIGTIGGTRASETDIGAAMERLETLLPSLDGWSAASVRRVLVVADPLTLIGREDAAELYASVAEHVVTSVAASGDASSRTIRKGLEEGIDGIPGDVRIFIKRGSLRVLPGVLADVAAHGEGERGPA